MSVFTDGGGRHLALQSKEVLAEGEEREGEGKSSQRGGGQGRAAGSTGTTSVSKLS